AFSCSVFHSTVTTFFLTRRSPKLFCFLPLASHVFTFRFLFSFSPPMARPKEPTNKLISPPRSMTQARSYAALSATTPLAPFSFERRALGDIDVKIDIKYCGVCSSDLHQVRNEWKNSVFPMVPGHEIVGEVTAIGTGVTKFKVGDVVGVGCMIDSCLDCEPCKVGHEQYCESGFIGTYNGYEKDGKTLAQGGYSDHIVVRQEFVVHVPANLPLAAAAPLLCAGITTYS
ncbi:NADP-dependent alcohol hydrogenase, putative, partial [Bodo saltans]